MIYESYGIGSESITIRDADKEHGVVVDLEGTLNYVDLDGDEVRCLPSGDCPKGGLFETKERAEEALMLYLLKNGANP